jgi:hypothetical protein
LATPTSPRKVRDVFVLSLVGGSGFGGAWRPHTPELAGGHDDDLGAGPIRACPVPAVKLFQVGRPLILSYETRKVAPMHE